MSNLSVLRNAISTNDLKTVREFCELYNKSNFGIDPCSLSVMALENNNLDIFKILFIWSWHNGSIWLFNHSITNNQLPFVQYLYPFVQDDLDNNDRKFALKETEAFGFEALHVWLEQAFHPQSAFDR